MSDIRALYTSTFDQPRPINRAGFFHIQKESIAAREIRWPLGSCGKPKRRVDDTTVEIVAHESRRHGRGRHWRPVEGETARPYVLTVIRQKYQAKPQ